jgi:hypothetical protein
MFVFYVLWDSLLRSRVPILLSCGEMKLCTYCLLRCLGEITPGASHAHWRCKSRLVWKFLKLGILLVSSLN